MTYPELIRVESIGEYVARLRLTSPNDSPEVLKARAKRWRQAMISAAEYNAKIRKTIESMDERYRPVDQCRRADFYEQKKFAFINISWSLTRRWPWVAVFEDGYVSRPAAWESAGIPINYHRSIGDCLLFCMKHSADIPRFAPIAGQSIISALSNDMTELPELYMIMEGHIPPGIVRKYPVARCGEALAFVFNFHGSALMDEIRRLIIAPSPEKVAEAYAIATSQRFRGTRLVERELAMMEPVPLVTPSVPREMPELVRAHPTLLRIGSVANRVLASLRAAPGDSHSVQALAGGESASGGARKNVGIALGKLEAKRLAKSDGDRWILGVR